jgi:DNA-binding XRE family transcriptional regulator
MSVTLIKDRRVPKPGRSRAQDVDRFVGMKMRERRIMLGLTQQQMAELIGVTYQQAHKYEKGINRVAAGRLYNIAQALGVDINYFFDGMEAEQQFKPTPPSSGCCSSSRATSSACRAADTRKPCATWPAPCPMPR